MLALNGLHAYYGKSHILQGVDLRVDDGEIVSLLGRNGVGRSTTCKAIMGLVPAQGSISFRGREINGLRTDQIAHLGIGYVPEDRRSSPPSRCARTSSSAEARRPGRALDLRRDVHAVSQSARAPAQSAGGPVGRRAADAHHVPHADGRSGADHHRRADRGPGAQAGGASGRAARRDCAPRHRHPAGRAEAHRGADISRRLYVMGHGHIVFEGTPAEFAGDDAVRRQWLKV